MSDHVYKKIEITGTSSESQDDAIRQAIKRASETVNSPLKKSFWHGVC